MSPAWTPELSVDETLARRLIAAQFPQLAGASIRRAGAGWDNAAYLVDERYIFRFPQRAVAATLMERELTFMPEIAAALPLPVPKPQFAGSPQFEYPWKFIGYERVAGETACSRLLSYADRKQLAVDLGEFLRTLHAIDASTFDAELPPDTIGKLDRERLKVDEDPPKAPLTLVHGDLYARHLLLDESNRLSGVIDWGDLHRGHPAVDLSVVHMMIPARVHGDFLDVYGDVDDRAWRFARYRARHHAGMTLEFSVAVGDEDLERASRQALRFIEGD